MKISDEANEAAIAKSIERAFSKRPFVRSGPLQGFGLIGRIASHNRIPYRQAALLVEEYALQHNIEVDWSIPKHLQPKNIVYWGVTPALAFTAYSFLRLIHDLYRLHQERHLSVLWLCLIVSALTIALGYFAVQLKTTFNQLNVFLKPLAAMPGVMKNQP